MSPCASYLTSWVIKYVVMICDSLQIREETNTKIDLPTENSDSETIVITGKRSNCEAARDRILTIQRDLVRKRTDEKSDRRRREGRMAFLMNSPQYDQGHELTS